MNEETVFDHIRKKAKNFLVFDKFKIKENAEPFVLTEHCLSKNQTEFSGSAFGPLKATTSDEVQRDAEVISGSEPEEREKDTFYKELDLSLNLPNTTAEFSVRSPCFSNSLVMNAQLEDNGRLSEGSKKQLYSPFGLKRQCCLMAKAEKIKDADSFLGFKSIFSFL